MPPGFIRPGWLRLVPAWNTALPALTNQAERSCAPSMLSWRVLGPICAYLFSFASVSAFMSSDLTQAARTHDENLTNAKSAKRKRLQATLEEMTDANVRTGGDYILPVVESVCKHGGATIGENDIKQTFGLLRKLENSAFEHLTTNEIPATTKTDANSPTTEELAHFAHAAADALRRLMQYYGTSGGNGRKAILAVANRLASFSNDSTEVPKALATVLVVSALAIGDQSCENHRSLARAAASGVLPNKPISDDTHSMLAVQAVRELLVIALSDRTMVDLHIVTSICRSFIQDATELQSECSKVVRSIFGLPEDGNIDENTKLPEVGKIEAAAALALSAQVGPWKYVKPAALVEIATDMNLWAAAERICYSAIKSASKDCEDAVLVLIESAGAAAQYRQMDSFATEFYDHGGRLKFAEARLFHAYDTITKVAARRQFPLIEKQIERIDRAFERTKTDIQGGEDYDDSGPTEARDFAITKLVEMGEVEAAHRLASLWGRDFIYDDKELERMAKARKEKYLQWEETEVGIISTIPDVLSDPSLFVAEYKEMMSGIGSCVGFDCEFGDEQTKGVALLQLSTLSKAILVDIPALSVTKEGCKALQSTIGDLLAGHIPVVGFACGEDVRRLRASPSVFDTHWLGSSSAVVDIKPLIATHSPVHKHTGLSSACEKYLKKPLDKAEQCSLWMNRPLSQNQRAYAALDAFTCAAIYDILPYSIKNK